MKKFLRTAWILPWCIVPVLTSCGPTLEEGADARIRVSPPRQVTFTRVTVGEERSMPFVVASVGKDELDVQRLEWDGSPAVSLVIDNAQLPIALSSLESLPIAVEFKPTLDNPSPNGVIRIYTNDTSMPVYTLDVAAQQLAPVIHVSPTAEERLVFGQTEPGDTASRSVVVTNEGDLPLNISKIALTGPDAFSYRITGGQNPPIRLAPNHATAITLKVSFKPDSTGKAEGTLAFTSDDPVTPIYNLPIIANSNTPCLQIQPTLLEFSPAVSIGNAHTKTVLLTSCSDVPLIVQEVLKTAGPDFFTSQLIDGNKELRLGESARLEITYTPVSEGSSQAVYTIFNNDPLQRNAQLTVMASASANQPPVANARGRLSSSSPWSKTLDLAPLDSITLDGSLSSDKETKDASSLKYYWSIKSAPKDSTSQIVPNPIDNGMTASFFLDLAGNYELCLSVEDSDQMPSQNTDCVSVSVVPRSKIHVQLVWHTPGDSNPSDKDGTDLDLHFMTLPDGHWAEQGHPQLNDGTDVYFGNPESTWVVPGFGKETPSLDRDDKDGEGPENINVDPVATCRWYAVGVHYYKDNGFGLSYATVRIYIDGKLRFEDANFSLAQTAAFKQVAWIIWDGTQARIYESKLSYTSNNEWVGMTPVIPNDVLTKAQQAFPNCFD